MCPLISAKFRRLQDMRADRALRLVELTLDPAYDRPEVLRRYARTFGADPRTWTLITGDAEPVLNFAARFGITAFADPNIGLIHAENTVLIGADGRIASEIGETAWLPREIVARIDATHGRSTNPIDRLNLWLSSAAVAVCGNSVAGFSGLQDLAVVLAIFAALAYLVYRLARALFIENA